MGFRLYRLRNCLLVWRNLSLPLPFVVVAFYWFKQFIYVRENIENLNPSMSIKQAKLTVVTTHKHNWLNSFCNNGHCCMSNNMKTPVGSIRQCSRCCCPLVSFFINIFFSSVVILIVVNHFESVSFVTSKIFRVILQKKKKKKKKINLGSCLFWNGFTA